MASAWETLSTGAYFTELPDGTLISPPTKVMALSINLEYCMDTVEYTKALSGSNSRDTVLSARALLYESST